MNARDRRNVTDDASLALLRGRVVDIYGRDIEVFNRDSKLCRRCHRKLVNSEEEGRPCCENARAHETYRESEPDRFMDEQLQKLRS